MKKIIETICKDGNVLIPVEFDYQEKILLDELIPLNRKIHVVNGKTPMEQRSDIYKGIEHEKNAIILAKVGVMREGISINNLSYMIGYFSQKSYIRVIQLIGRIERLGGLAEPIFYDIYDNTPFSKKHYTQRKEIYAKEKLQLIEKHVELNYEQGEYTI